jgi:hypothetical protein
MRLTARRLIRSPRLSTSWSTRLTSWPFRNPALERIQRAGRGFVQQPRRATGARTASSASRRERERRGGRSRAGSRLDLVHCGSRKVGGRDACSRAEARVSVTRLTSADRHTSVNQSCTPSLRLAAVSLQRATDVPLAFRYWDRVLVRSIEPAASRIKAPGSTARGVGVELPGEGAGRGDSWVGARCDDSEVDALGLDVGERPCMREAPTPVPW